MATGDWLLLRVPSTSGAAPNWITADATGALLPDSSAAGSDLAAAAAGRQVALLVPAGDVSLFEAQLPPGNEARLQQLAPFALEEQVSEDLEQLHFAIGARNGATGTVPVAVADRAQVRQWLEYAASLSLQPRAIFAESDLSPRVPGQVTLVCDRGQMVVRDGEARPVVFPPDAVELALDTLRGPQADPAELHVVVYCTPEDWPQYEVAVEALRARVGSLRVQLLTGGLMALHAGGISASAPVNLLQGEFRPASRGGFDWRRWRVAAALLAGLLVLHAGLSFWELARLRSASAALESEVTRVYGTIFPGQRPGPSPRRALEARMRAAAGGGNAQGELMPLLAAVAAARQNVPVAKLDSMSFRPGSLQLKLSAPDAATLEQFSQALRAGGYSAQVSSGRQHDGGFEGQIDMKAGT